MFSGGIIPPLCPLNAANPADLAMRHDSAQGAAAAIKADTAGAAARRAAVRYLGTVDCHYWPEAQLALANALRTDRNYCVRREAAYALLNGCCCTRITVEALSIAVSGSNRDGNPSETDEQVKAVAMMALQHCLECLHAVPPSSLPMVTPPPTRPVEPVPNPREKIPEPVPTGATSKNDAGKTGDKIVPVAARTVTRTRTTPAEYYKQIEETPWSEIIASAQKTFQNARHSAPTAMQKKSDSPGLLALFSHALSGPAPEEYTVETPVPPVSTPRPRGDQPRCISGPASAGREHANPQLAVSCLQHRGRGHREAQHDHGGGTARHAGPASPDRGHGSACPGHGCVGRHAKGRTDAKHHRGRHEPCFGDAARPGATRCHGMFDPRHAPRTRLL